MCGLYLTDVSGQEKKNEDTVGVPLLGVSQGRWGSRNHTPCCARQTVKCSMASLSQNSSLLELRIVLICTSLGFSFT